MQKDKHLLALRKTTQLLEKLIHAPENIIQAPEKIIQAPEKNILQHDHNIFANCPGWVTPLCTFALWQQLSIVLVNLHFFLNQSQNENEIRTFDRLIGIA